MCKVIRKSTCNRHITRRGLPDIHDRPHGIILWRPNLLAPLQFKRIPEPQRLIPSTSDDSLTIGAHGEVEDSESVSCECSYLGHGGVFPYVNLILDGSG
jgi:hypothetical protein